MEKLTIYLVALATLALGGCASTTYKAPKYKDDHSKAYNIAYAGGLYEDIEDSEVPEDSLYLKSTAAYGAATVAVGFGAASVYGLLNWQGAAIGLLTWAIKPDSHGARNSLVAWMPESEALTPKEAQTKMLAITSNAIRKTLDENGVDYDELSNDKYPEFILYGIFSESLGCPKREDRVTKNKKACTIFAAIRTPVYGETPSFASADGKSSYAFTSGDMANFNKIKLKGGDGSLDDVEWLGKISANLPQWAYIFASPKQTRNGQGGHIKAPVIISDSRYLFFVIPDKASSI